MFIFVNEIQPNICFTKKIKRMKKLYTLALGLALGAIGLSANAAVTTLPWWSNPENNTTVGYEEMWEYIEYFWAPNITWGEDPYDAEVLYYNSEADCYRNYGEGWDPFIELDILVNGQPWTYEDYETQQEVRYTVSAEIYTEYYGDVPGYCELDIKLGDVWNSLYYDFEEDFTFQIIIPEGSIFVGEEGIGNQAITLNYNISLENPYLNYPSTELDGDKFFIYWDEPIKFEVEFFNYANAYLYYPGAEEPIIVKFYGPTTFDPFLVEGQTPEVNDNAIELFTDELLAEYGPGRYYGWLVSKEVFNLAGDKYNEQVAFDFYLEEVLPTIEATNVIFTNESIVLQYPGVVTVNEECEYDIYIYSTYGTEQELRISPSEITPLGNEVILSLDDFPIYEDIEYYFIVPEGIFIIGDEYQNAGYETAFDSKTVGVKGIAVGIENAPVYNLQGVKVGNSVEGLSNGIYIINGKKVLIRK